MDHESKNLQHKMAYVKSVDEAARRIRFVISTDHIDRDNEQIETSAVAAAIPEFAKNPIALADHQHKLADGSSPVVGSWDTGSFRVNNHACEMDLIFATTPIGEERWQLYKSGHMRAVSIGYKTIKSHYEQRDGKKIRVITKIELYEISCVSVPANRDSLAKEYEEFAADIKMIESSITKQIETLTANLTSIEDRLEEILEEIKDLIIGDHGDLAKSLLGGDEAESISDSDYDSLSKADVQRIATKLKQIAAR